VGNLRRIKKDMLHQSADNKTIKKLLEDNPLHSLKLTVEETKKKKKKYDNKKT